MDFDSISAEQGSALLRYATMVTADPHAAQDAVQASLERAFRRWDRIGGLDRPDLYVRRMVINECFGQGRRNRRMTDDQIADELGCRATTVRGYHFRAIRRLRDNLDPELLSAPKSNGSA